MKKVKKYFFVGFAMMFIAIFGFTIVSQAQAHSGSNNVTPFGNEIIMGTGTQENFDNFHNEMYGLMEKYNIPGCMMGGDGFGNSRGGPMM